MALLKINDNVHKKLKEVSEKRKEQGDLNHTMAAIVHEFVLKLHKRECQK